MSTHTSPNRWAIAVVMILLSVAANGARAASAKEIDIKVDAALERFYQEVEGARAFAKAAEALLVFPNVIKAGFGIGGEFGEGALRIGGTTADYYSTASASFGLQFGAQSKTVILVFLDRKALSEFRQSAGWEAGVDGSIALVKVGTGVAIDTISVRDPIVGFIFGNKGLMYNLTLEGTKFSKLKK